jgi:hypothetical protein
MIRRRRETQRLSRREWSWIILVPLSASLLSFGGFIPLVPIYVLAILVVYLLTRRFPDIFDREKYALFVVKVVISSVVFFFILAVPYVYVLAKYLKHD